MNSRRPKPGPTSASAKPARGPRKPAPTTSRPAAAASSRPTSSTSRPATGARPTSGPRPAPKAGARPVSKPGRVHTSKPRPGTPGNLERLQKILAHAGIASRRACEELILEGHVHVNGKVVTELGAKADPLRDEITVDHKPIQREAPIYVLVNKPTGYITTVKDDQGRPTVMALVSGINARLYPVGRLDFNSEGLLLLTNDGSVAERLTSPDHELPKVYSPMTGRWPSASRARTMSCPRSTW